MIITVDAGNSRIKYALWRDNSIVDRAVMNYEVDDGMDTFDRLFAPLKKSVDEKPSRVLAVCVAEESVSRTLGRWVKQHWQLDVEYLETQKQYNNIINAYSNPGEYGADRWASIIAGLQACSESSVVVIGAGTAITIDLVGKSGKHLGGYILPSYQVMHAALLSDTARVESTLQNEMSINSAVPDNTNDAVNQGLHILLQAGIREIYRLAQKKMGKTTQILITGGFAKVILDYPDMPAMQYKPDLVMQGMYEIMTTSA